MKIISCLLSIVFLFSELAFSQASSKKHWVVEEPIESGKVIYRVYEEDLSLRKNQNQISQHLIFKKISHAHDLSILSTALRSKKITNDDRQQEISRAGKPLWIPIKNNWTEADEKDYQAWFEQNANADFSLVSGLMADCADVGFLFRWVYAREKKMPMASTLSGSGKLFGHFSSSQAWDKLPTNADWKKDERFKAAMRYLFDNTYTRTLIEDLYPTEITPQYVHPGSLYMIIRQETGHTQTLFTVDKTNLGISTLWGNEPAAEAIYSSWIIWEPAVRNLFGSWRWPVFKNGVWKLTSAQQMPGYSQEQFIKRNELDEELFQFWVYERLGIVITDEAKFKQQIGTLYNSLDYRFHITSRAAVVCGAGNPCSATSEDYDNYSTQSRDKRLIGTQTQMFQTMTRLGGPTAQVVVDILAQYNLDREFLAGAHMKYSDYILSETNLNKIQAEARFTFLQRWGINQPLDSSSEFQSLTQLIYANASDRRYFVDDSEICVGCPPPESTLKMDRGLVHLAQRSSVLLKASDLNPQVVSDAADQYRGASLGFWINIQSPFCENPSSCTLYDAVMKDGGFDRFKKWSSTPGDTLLRRWGLEGL